MLNDLHLNLFYSYNRDSELIENNLTRAFIVTLRLLSSTAREFLLKSLLEEHLHKLRVPEISFKDAQLALQGYMDRGKSRGMAERYLLTVASDRVIMAEEGGAEFPGLDAYHSIPDGWIFDQKAGYCILIEAKVGSSPLTEAQVLSHANYWLGVDPTELPNHLISLTWMDVLTAIQEVQGEALAKNLNSQERMLLAELQTFIGYYGYRQFIGFQWEQLQPAPRFGLRKRLQREMRGKAISGFAELLPPPKFRIGTGLP
jgi:hypothetical protein